MSKNWLKKWKICKMYKILKSYYNNHYINIPNSIQNELLKKIESNMYDLLPGPIDNSEIIIPGGTYLNDNAEENPIIKLDIEFISCVKPISKNLWEYFYSLYGGGPVIKVSKVNESVTEWPLPKHK